MAGHFRTTVIRIDVEWRDMLGRARSLALEVADLGAASSFYAETLGLSGHSSDDTERVFRAGDCSLALRSVGILPRGGAHVHYAFAVSPDEYDDFYDRLAVDQDLEERVFGDVRSLYCFDPAGHCVELGERGEGAGITGVFEIVLEVTDLDAATERYRNLGFDLVDRGSDRRRVRLSTGGFDLELWEPQYGIANARGGDHVDFAVEADDPEAVAASVDPDVWCRTDDPDDGVRLRDWDGHTIELLAP